MAATGDRRENVLLRELVAVYSHLSGLASQDSDVDAVVRLVAHRTGCAVAVLSGSVLSDAPESVLAAVPPNAAALVRAVVGDVQLVAVLAAATRNRRTVALSGLAAPEVAAPEIASTDVAGTDVAVPDIATPESGALEIAGADVAVPAVAAPEIAAKDVVVAPVVVGDEVVAHLITLSDPDRRAPEQRVSPDLGDLTLLLTEHAATVCGIILGRERVVAAAAGQARTDLLEGLLLARDRDTAEAERWAGHLGFVRGTEHHVLAVGVPDTPERGRILAVAEHAITRGRSASIVAVRESEVVAVVPSPNGSSTVRELAQACRTAVLQRHPDAGVVAGIGGCCRTPGEISRSYGEARSAVDAAGRMGRVPGVLAFSDLGVHRLLLQVPDLAELRAFAVDVLGDLVRDSQTGADLLGTLTTWFRCNGSPQRTARELHVHPNTVTYRIRRVEEIAGLRLDHYRDRLMAQVACEIVEVLA